jgi:hypothetical protein
VGPAGGAPRLPQSAPPPPSGPTDAGGVDSALFTRHPAPLTFEVRNLAGASRPRFEPPPVLPEALPSSAVPVHAVTVGFARRPSVWVTGPAVASLTRSNSSLGQAGPPHLAPSRDLQGCSTSTWGAVCRTLEDGPLATCTTPASPPPIASAAFAGHHATPATTATPARWTCNPLDGRHPARAALPGDGCLRSAHRPGCVMTRRRTDAREPSPPATRRGSALPPTAWCGSYASPAGRPPCQESRWSAAPVWSCRLAAHPAGRSTPDQASSLERTTLDRRPDDAWWFEVLILRAKLAAGNRPGYSRRHPGTIGLPDHLRLERPDGSLSSGRARWRCWS